MKYLIVAGGTVDEQFAVDIIKNGGYEVIIAVDAGMDFCYKSRIMPDVIVGDFDSVEQEALEFFLGQEQMDIHRLNPEKDDTDTEYALRFAIGRGATKITVLGGTGSRLDHVIGNVVLLGAGLENPVTVDFVSAFGSKEKYLQIGRGMVITKNGEIVAGASSYTRYHEGIEIEVDTVKSERRKHLATIVCAALILNCLNEGLYPSWDAQNRNSVHLAEKFGYEFDHEYVAYEVASDRRTPCHYDQDPLCHKNSCRSRS